jgi:hypothetical protein
VTHTCNPSYSGGRVQADQGLKPAIVPQDAISKKKPSQKRAGGVAQGAGSEFKPQYRKKEKKDQKDI